MWSTTNDFSDGVTTGHHCSALGHNYRHVHDSDLDFLRVDISCEEQREVRRLCLTGWWNCNMPDISYKVHEKVLFSHMLIREEGIVTWRIYRRIKFWNNIKGAVNIADMCLVSLSFKPNIFFIGQRTKATKNTDIIIARTKWLVTCSYFNLCA